MFITIALLAALEVSAAHKLSQAEYAIKTLGAREGTKAEAEAYRVQLPALGAAWAKEEVELIDTAIGAGKSPDALARARDSLATAKQRDYLGPQVDLLTAARDRAAQATLDLAPGLNAPPLSALPTLGSRVKWVLTDQPADSAVGARGRAFLSDTSKRLDALSVEAEKQGLSDAALFLARMATAYGSTRNVDALAGAAKAGAPVKWTLRVSGAACTAVEASRPRFQKGAESAVDSAVAEIVVASCVTETRDVVRQETVTSSRAVPTGQSDTVTKRGKCRTVPHQSKSYGCLQTGSNGLCTRYGDVVTNSSREECEADQTSTTSRFTTESESRKVDVKKKVISISITGKLKVTYRGQTREEALSAYAQNDPSQGAPVEDGAFHVFDETDKLRLAIASKLDGAAAAGAPGDLATQNALLRVAMGGRYASPQTIAMLAASYGLSEEQSRKMVDYQKFELARFETPPHWDLHAPGWDADNVEDRAFRAGIDARAPKTESSSGLSIGFKHSNTLDNLGTLSFGLLNIAPPGAGSTKGFVVGIEGLFSDREDLELVYGLGVRLGNAGDTTTGSLIFDGRINFGAAVTAGPVTFYALATAAYESYVVSRAFLQPEARLLLDINGAGLELMGGLPLFERDSAQPAETDVRPLRLGARLILPEGVPFALAGGYARDPFGTRVTIDLAYVFAHRDR